MILITVNMFYRKLFGNEKGRKVIGVSRTLNGPTGFLSKAKTQAVKRLSAVEEPQAVPEETQAAANEVQTAELCK